MTTTVLLRPHLAKFVIAIYGDPAVIPWSDDLYYDFLTCLTKTYIMSDRPLGSRGAAGSPLSSRRGAGGEAAGLVPVKFRIPVRNIDRFGHSFNIQQRHFFNQRLAKRFNHYCFVFINYLQHSRSMSIRASIYEVIDRFDIALDVDYKALETSYFRRISEMQKIFDGIEGKK